MRYLLVKPLKPDSSAVRDQGIDGYLTECTNVYHTIMSLIPIIIGCIIVCTVMIQVEHSLS